MEFDLVAGKLIRIDREIGDQDVGSRVWIFDFTVLCFRLLRRLGVWLLRWSRGRGEGQWLCATVAIPRSNSIGVTGSGRWECQVRGGADVGKARGGFWAYVAGGIVRGWCGGARSDWLGGE
jgi:hypothetical protein